MGNYGMSSKREAARMYLKQLKDKYEHLQRVKERYNQDFALIFGSGGIDYSKEHVSGGKMESGNTAVEMMVDRENEIKRLERDYLVASKQISDQVESLSTKLGSEVITRRYLIFKAGQKFTTYETIAEDMEIDLRHCIYIHGQALDEIYTRFIQE